MPWGSMQGLHLHGAAHVQPGPTACKPLACSVPVRGWVAGGCIWALSPAAVIYGNWATVHGKKLVGAVPTAFLWAVTCRARVCAVVFNEVCGYGNLPLHAQRVCESLRTEVLMLLCLGSPVIFCKQPCGENHFIFCSAFPVLTIPGEKMTALFS